VGDYNGDGIVDSGDYALWRHQAGNTGSYETWRAHFGQSNTGAAGTLTGNTIPEPSSIVLLVTALGCAAFCARR
jgi:hypothetical protein